MQCDKLDIRGLDRRGHFQTILIFVRRRALNNEKENMNISKLKYKECWTKTSCLKFYGRSDGLFC